MRAYECFIVPHGFVFPTEAENRRDLQSLEGVQDFITEDELLSRTKLSKRFRLLHTTKYV